MRWVHAENHHINRIACKRVCPYYICVSYMLHSNDTWQATWPSDRHNWSLRTAMLLWTQHKPDMQEQSVCQTHTPVAAVHLNDGRALVLPYSCLRWDCQTPGKSAAPSQVCSHHPAAQCHCHDSFVMLWTHLASCLQLQLKWLPQPAECQVQLSRWDMSVCWIT